MATLRHRLHVVVARLPGVRAHVRAVATEVLDATKTRAQAHRDDGTFARSLRLVRGRIDTRVVSTDRQAIPKEFGHTYHHTGRHVEGLHVLGGATADVAARRQG